MDECSVHSVKVFFNLFLRCLRFVEELMINCFSTFHCFFPGKFVKKKKEIPFEIIT